MAIVDLITGVSVDTGNDSIVIVKNFEVIPGGRTLLATGVPGLVDDFPLPVIKAGHVIMERTSDKELLPLPITGILPTGYTAKGILTSTVLKSRPFASVMIRGTVNQLAAPYPFSAGIKSALNLIIFTQD